MDLRNPQPDAIHDGNANSSSNESRFAVRSGCIEAIIGGWSPFGGHDFNSSRFQSLHFPASEACRSCLKV